MKHQLIFYVLNIYCIFVFHFLYSQYFPCGNLLLLVTVSVLLTEMAVELDAMHNCLYINQKIIPVSMWIEGTAGANYIVTDAAGLVIIKCIAQIVRALRNV